MGNRIMARRKRLKVDKVQKVEVTIDYDKLAGVLCRSGGSI